MNLSSPAAGWIGRRRPAIAAAAALLVVLVHYLTLRRVRQAQLVLLGGGKSDLVDFAVSTPEPARRAAPRRTVHTFSRLVTGIEDQNLLHPVQKGTTQPHGFRPVRTCPGVTHKRAVASVQAQLVSS